MGLPMFYGTGEQSPTRIIEKVDGAAASSRSPIRRERTIREAEPRRRFHERHQSRGSGGFTTHLIRNNQPRNHTRARRDNRAEHTVGGSNPWEPRWSARVETILSGDDEYNESRRQWEAGDDPLPDPLQHHRHGRRTRALRSPRTSALRFQVEPRSPSAPSAEASAEEQTLLARPYMPSPPYSFSDNGATSRPPRRRRGSLEMIHAEPTPGFAPARGVHGEHDEHEAMANHGNAARQHTPPGESSWTASYPPLRRVGHLFSQAETQSSTYEGFGDHHRSLSTSSSEVEHDTWDTLLTTMEPDDHLPSADSSFTSATASQSTRQSRRSSQTPATSFGSSAATSRTDRRRSRAAGAGIHHLHAPELMEMDLDIQSPQYDCLTQEGRISMRWLLAMIQHSRQSRNHNRSRAHYGAASELRQQFDENVILWHHFRTVMMTDEANAASRGSSPRSGFGSRRHPELGQHSTHADREDESATHDLRIMEYLSWPRPNENTLSRGPSPTSATAERTNPRPTAVSPAGPAPPPWSPVHDPVPLPELEHQGQPDSRSQSQSRDRSRNQDRTTADTSGTDNEWAGLQRFMERMARRQDIPDEWWASIGLARTIRENQSQPPSS